MTLVYGSYAENWKDVRATLFSSRQFTVKAISSSLPGGRLVPPMHSPTKTKADSDQLRYLSSRFCLSKIRSQRATPYSDMRVTSRLLTFARLNVGGLRCSYRLLQNRRLAETAWCRSGRVISLTLTVPSPRAIVDRIWQRPE